MNLIETKRAVTVMMAWLVIGAGLLYATPGLLFGRRIAESSVMVFIPDFYCLYSPSNIKDVPERFLSPCGYIHNADYEQEYGVSVYIPVGGFWALTPGRYEIEDGSVLISGSYVARGWFVAALFAVFYSFVLFRRIVYPNEFFRRRDLLE